MLQKFYAMIMNTNIIFKGKLLFISNTRSMINKIIKLSDKVGIRPEISFKGKPNHKTLFGGLFTIILVLLTIIGIFFLGRDIIERQKPTFYSGNSYNSNPFPLILNSSNFPFYIGIEDPTNNLNYFIDDTVYRIKAEYGSQVRTISNNGNVNITKKFNEIKLKRCEISDFLGYESIFSSLDFKNAYCLDSSQNITIRGSFSNNIWNFVRISIFACNNSTDKVTCRSQREIDAKMKSTYLAFQYGEFVSDPGNFYFPMKKILGDYNVAFSNFYQKKIAAIIKRTNVTTDTGFIFDSNENEIFYQLDGPPIEMFWPFAPGPTDYILQLTLRLSYSETKNHRSYIKMQSVVAQIGGLYNFLYLIIKSVVLYFTKPVFISEFLNQSCSSNYSKSSNISEIKNSKPLNNFLTKATRLKQVMKTEDESIIYSKHSFVANCNNYLSIYLKDIICLKFSHKNYVKVYNKIVHYIEKKLEINSLFSLYLEISKLKKIIFDDNQLFLFNSMKNDLEKEINEDLTIIDKSKENQNFLDNSNQDPFSVKITTRILNLMTNRCMTQI
jgi:hypothetical protein